MSKLTAIFFQCSSLLSPKSDKSVEACWPKHLTLEREVFGLEVVHWNVDSRGFRDGALEDNSTIAVVWSMAGET